MLGYGLSQVYWWVKLWASEIWEPHGTFLPGSLFLRLTVFSRSLCYFSEEPIFFSLPDKQDSIISQLPGNVPTQWSGARTC